MSKYAHVVKLAGSLINDGFLENIVSKHRQYFGVAVVKDDKIMVNHVQQAPSLDVLKKVQEQFKDSVCVFAFGDVGNILPEDMQPFVILKDADGNAVCTVCLDGDFDRHRKTNEAHIGEYLVAKNNLEKRIKKYADKGMSISGIIDDLNDDLIKEAICALWGDRGAITFCFSDGQVCTIQAGNPDEGKFEWGYASNTYNYSDKPEAKKSIVASGLDMLKDLMTGPKAHDVAPQNGTAVTKAVSPEPTATNVQEQLPPGTVLVKPDFSDISLNTRKKQKAFYEDRLGYEPQRYKDAPPLLRMPKADGGFKWQMADTKQLGILKHTMEMYPPKDAASPLTQEQPSVETKPEVKPEVKSEAKPEPVQETQTQAPKELPPWLQSKKTGTGNKSTVREPAPTASKTAAVALPAGGNQQAQEKVPATVRSDKLPVLSPDVKQKMQEIMKRSEFVGTFGEGMKQIIDPKALKAQIEQEIPDVAKALGIGNDMGIFAGWKFEQFFLLAQSIISVAKNNPEAGAQMAAKMMFDLRNDGLKRQITNLTNPSKAKAA